MSAVRLSLAEMIGKLYPQSLNNTVAKTIPEGPQHQQIMLTRKGKSHRAPTLNKELQATKKR